MAENDPSGLQLLIQQRRNRPSFTRTISWEISKSSSVPVRKSKKSGQRRKKTPSLEEQRDSDDEVEKEGSELSGSSESEYFSAEEKVPENESDDGDSDGENWKSMDGTWDDISSSIDAISVNKTAEEHKPGQSKKQKRKRRKRLQEGYIQYTDYTAPFQREENINFSISDFREELMDRAENVSAHVPSLFELCARFIWSKNNHVSASSLCLLPGPMKRAVSAQRQDQAFSSLQLSCLYRTLAELESATKMDKRLLTCLVTRNVWFPCYSVKWQGSLFLDPSIPRFVQEQRGREVTRVIPYLYAMCGLADYETAFQPKEDVRIMLYGTSLMVSVLDLMAPHHFRPSRKKEREWSSLEEEDRALVICGEVVLKNLHKRYPETVNTFRKRALAYFYWLRGRSKLALDHLIQFSETAEGVLEKVYILLEAASLCQLQSQMASARKLFQLSHELLLDPRHARTSEDKEEVRAQQQMLLANTYDQGVLTEEKALQSLSSWQYLTTIPCSPSSALAAAESVLCYHLSHLPGQNVKKKIQFLLDHIRTCRGLNWRLSMHLSLLHAWLGDRFESLSAYLRMVSNENSPGQEFKPDNVTDREFNAWQCVYDTVVNTHALTSLTVVWRTQLGLFRVVSNNDVFCGHMHGRHHGLRISPEGHLTDDLHLLLPPIRAVNLDLYTGKLILPSVPGQTYVQRTMFNSCYNGGGFTTPDSCYYPNGSYALTSTELYSDDTRVQVHLLTNGATSVLKTHAAVAYLQLTLASGQRTKINMKQVLKTALRKEVDKEIRNKYPAKSPENRSQQELALKGLEYACSHNLAYVSAQDVVTIGELVQRMTEPKEKGNTSKARSKEQHRSRAKAQLKAYTQFQFLVMDFVSYGHTVLVQGILQGSLKFFMFLDASSKESFASPVTYIWRPTHNVRASGVILDQQGHRVPRAEVLCVYSSSIQGGFRFYGQGGKELQYNTVDLRHEDCQCMLGFSVYSIENSQNRNEEQQGIPTLTETRFHPNASTETFVYDFDPDLKEVKAVADRLLQVRSDGLRVLRPETMMPEPLLHDPNSECQCRLSEDGMALLVKPVRVSVLAEKTVLTSVGSPTVMVPVAVNDYLLMLGIQERCSVAEPVVEIAFCVKVPGHTTECCFVGQIGYLISATFHKKSDQDFCRETVCHLSPSGQLLSLLPCLGPGPHSFCPVLLSPPPPSPPGQVEETEEGRKPESPAWHVYMRDGHEGIMAVRL